MKPTDSDIGRLRLRRARRRTLVNAAGDTTNRLDGLLFVLAVNDNSSPLLPHAA